MNKQNFKRVLDHIKAHPETWDQSTWHCDSSHCFFGWAQIFSGRPANHDTVVTDAREWLDLSSVEASYISSADRTIADFEAAMNDEYSETGFNLAGFNRHGFNHDGFNHDGFNRHGFHRDGFNRAGFDRDGFDRDGYDRDGFNRDGFNRDGYDRAGYDRDGFNLAGYDRHGLDRRNKRKPEAS